MIPKSPSSPRLMMIYPVAEGVCVGATIDKGRGPGQTQWEIDGASVPRRLAETSLPCIKPCYC
jgi:hypothetical protein